MIPLSKTVQQLKPSGIRAFFDLVLGMKDVISLGVGEPDFVTPWHVTEQAIHSLEQGFTSYTSNKGMKELRQAICDLLQDRYRLKYCAEEQTLITVGVSEAFDLAMRATLNSGDKVLIPEPCYVMYSPIVTLSGGKPVPVKTTAQSGFKITPEDIKKAYTQGATILVINYPCNPTGTSYTKTELQRIATTAKKLGLFIVSDEVYDELTYDFKHTPIATLKGMKDHVLYLNGFSKSYAMTGFRIGWANGPAEIISAMTKIHQYTMLCAPITGQIAAIEAITKGDREVQRMKKEYHRRRNFIVSSLNDLGLDCHMPQGAFYAFPSIKSTGKTSLDFAHELLEQQKVALVPGTAFGEDCEGFVRISYASSMAQLKEAVSRIKIYLNS